MTRSREPFAQAEGHAACLERGPLFRTHLLRRKAHLIVSMHHIVSDGWSVRISFENYSTSIKHCSETPSALPDLPAIMLRRSARALDGKNLRPQLDYWKGGSGADAPESSRRPAARYRCKRQAESVARLGGVERATACAQQAKV
jgi:hypothetical protein